MVRIEKTPSRQWRGASQNSKLRAQEAHDLIQFPTAKHVVFDTTLAQDFPSCGNPRTRVSSPSTLRLL
jgi:hypothetical protein